MNDATPPFGEPLVRALKGAVLWQVLGVTTGIALAFLFASHGSLILVAVGGALGLAGAFAHGIVCLSPQLSALPTRRRAFATWLIAASISFAAGLALGFSEATASLGDFVAFVGNWFVLLALPTLPLAFLATHLLRGKNAA